MPSRLSGAASPAFGRVTLFAIILLFVIRVYRQTLRKLLVARGVTCLHSPTCSEYARQALLKYPVKRAIGLAVARLRDCHPFSGRPFIDPP